MTETTTTPATPATTPAATPDRPALPDHLSIDPRSPHHVAQVFEHGIGIHFNEKERFDVTEYCVSEGWIKVPAGKTLDRRGQPLTIKLKGKVAAFYK
ncbi:MAG: glutathione peroxidase [Burkholderiales bacterium PBB3]|nr:MAG: glutathione peroxidase [Burkholderiales bacterium PBB3]